jgi:hypothetical protein
MYGKDNNMTEIQLSSTRIKSSRPREYEEGARLKTKINSQQKYTSRVYGGGTRHPEAIVDSLRLRNVKIK